MSAAPSLPSSQPSSRNVLIRTASTLLPRPGGRETLTPGSPVSAASGAPDRANTQNKPESKVMRWPDTRSSVMRPGPLSVAGGFWSGKFGVCATAASGMENLTGFGLGENRVRANLLYAVCRERLNRLGAGSGDQCVVHGCGGQAER